jgi:hypothetical protein
MGVRDRVLMLHGIAHFLGLLPGEIESRFLDCLCVIHRLPDDVGDFFLRPACIVSVFVSRFS